MEKDIAIAGDLGALKLSLEGGKALVQIGVKEDVLEGAIKLQASASALVDASVLIDLLFAEIEKKSPAGAVAIEEAVKMILKNAVMAIQ